MLATAASRAPITATRCCNGRLLLSFSVMVTGRGAASWKQQNDELRPTRGGTMMLQPWHGCAGTVARLCWNLWWCCGHWWCYDRRCRVLEPVSPHAGTAAGRCWNQQMHRAAMDHCRLLFAAIGSSREPTAMARARPPPCLRQPRRRSVAGGQIRRPRRPLHHPAPPRPPHRRPWPAGQPAAATMAVPLFPSCVFPRILSEMMRVVIDFTFGTRHLNRVLDRRQVW